MSYLTTVRYYIQAYIKHFYAFYYLNLKLCDGRYYHRTKLRVEKLRELVHFT